MASWREKGYVSDSQDEGNEIDNETKYSSKQKTIFAEQEHRSLRHNSDSDDGGITGPEGGMSGGLSTNTTPVLDQAVVAPQLKQRSTTEKLEASLSKASSILAEIRSIKQSSQATPGRSSSISSATSELSSIPDSPNPRSLPGTWLIPSVASKHEISDLEDQDSDTGRRMPMDSREDIPEYYEPQTARTISPHIEVQPNQTVTEIAPRRTFRTRTANQLHPYSLEWGKYLQLCNERGIKPVRLPNINIPASGQHEDETQASFEDESQNQESLQPESAALVERTRPQLLIPSSPIALEDQDLLDDDELPNLGSLFQRTKSFSQRQRTNEQESTSNGVNRAQIYDLPLSDSERDTHVKPHSRRTKTDAQHESLPSPPQSGQPSVASSANEGSEAGQDTLPTPVLSSASRPRKRMIIEDDSQDGPAENVQHTGPELEDSSSNDEARTPEAVRTMQKRVRGVLPASWYSVAQAQRELEAKRKRHANKARSEAGEQHGIAQRKLRSTIQLDPPRRELDQDLVSEHEDDETSAENTTSEQSTFIANMHFPDTTLTNDDLQAEEAVYDGGFDPMLPTHERIRNFGQKRQVNLHRFERSTAQNRSRILNRTGSGAASRRTGPSHAKRPKCAAQQHLSVLDAPALQSGTRSEQPTFLRIAARKPRQKREHSGVKQVPKVFRLVEAEETQAILRDLVSRTTSLLDHSLDNTSHAAKLQQHASRRTSENAPFTRRHTSTLHPASDPKNTAGKAKVLREAELGTIVHCGQSEQHELRLTRLQALFPRMNRSGQGRFVHESVGPRTAQVEVLQPNPWRSKIRLTTNNQPSALELQNGSVAHVQAICSEARHPQRAVVHRPKKQKPVQRPSSGQTLLAPFAPDSYKLQLLLGRADAEVRAVLEHEFSTHQAAWFQGSKNGISMANQNTQQHFQLFLQVLKSYMPTALQDAETEADTRLLRSFVHRLIPNRGEIGAKGQVGDKKMDVLEYDVLVARNVLDLHVCLLNLVPAWAPLPRYLQYKVNFTDAHHELCVIALNAWKELFDWHHTHEPVVPGLWDWIYSMLSQLLVRWSAAEREARAEASTSLQQISEQVIRTVIQHNRVQTRDLIEKCLSHLAHARMGSITTSEHSAFSDTEKHLRLLSTAAAVTDLDHDILQRYFEICLPLSTDHPGHEHATDTAALLHGVRTAISTITSNNSTLKPGLKQAMASAYFLAARVGVKENQRSWEEFYAVTSTHCLDMFVGEPHLASVKSFFSHMVIQNETNAYFMDLRPYVLPLWIEVLLQPGFDPATALLTASLFRHERESISMPELQSKFSAPDSIISNEHIVERLPEIQHAATMHLIRSLHDQQAEPEAEWLLGGLDEGDAVKLLKTMFSTMKACWIGLRERPEEQDIYTILIHTALAQLELYPRKDFVLDSWFQSSATFPQPKRASLEKLLNGNEEPGTTFDKELRDVFDAEASHAGRFDRLSELQQELLQILLSSPESNNHKFYRHCVFIKQVLTRVIVSHTMALETRAMILGLLVDLLDNLECYNVAADKESRQQLLDAIAHILSVATEQISLFAEPEQDRIFGLTRLVLEWYFDTDDDLPHSMLALTSMLCTEAAGRDSKSAIGLLRTVALVS